MHRHVIRLVGAALAPLVLTACSAGSDESAPPEPAAPAPSPDAAAVLSALGAPYVSADLERGRRLFRRCAQCHLLAEGAGHRLGPNLHGVFGREVGALEDYPYSDALEAAGFTWSPAELDRWLASPNGYLPGNRMRFVGLREAEDRRDLIAYLAVETTR